MFFIDAILFNSQIICLSTSVLPGCTSDSVSEVTIGPTSGAHVLHWPV